MGDFDYFVLGYVEYNGVIFQIRIYAADGYYQAINQKHQYIRSPRFVDKQSMFYWIKTEGHKWPGGID